MSITMDRITTRVRNILPVTWDAMTSDKRVDDSVLTDPVLYSQMLFLGVEMDEEEQKGLNRLVVEFLAKHATVDLIPSAIDYWLEQKLSVVTSGTNETVTYPERIRALEKMKESLLEELARLEPIVAPLIPAIQTRRGASAPRLSTINDDLLTSNPQDFGPAYGPKVGSA